jgi:predicted DsbA family dithiol-disulfide isomerase
VTIVEFSDFHCPFCKRVAPTLAQIETQYGDKVKLIFRDFPIDQLHPGAREAHETARCASEQGKFWAYHDALFANTPKTSPEQLKASAQEVGLDLPAFEQCVSSGKYQTTVQQDVEEGTRPVCAILRGTRERRGADSASTHRASDASSAGETALQHRPNTFTPKQCGCLVTELP